MSTRHFVAFDAIQEFAMRARDAMFDWEIVKSWDGTREVEVIVEGDLTRYWAASVRARELVLEREPDQAEVDRVDAELRATIRDGTHRFLSRWAVWLERQDDRAILRAVRTSRPAHDGKIMIRLPNLRAKNIVLICEALETRGNTVVTSLDKVEHTLEWWLYVRGPDAAAEYAGEPWPFTTAEWDVIAVRVNVRYYR